MDDVRVWLAAVRLGWRWVNGELVYSMDAVGEGDRGVASDEDDGYPGRDHEQHLQLAGAHHGDTGHVCGEEAADTGVRIWVTADNIIMFMFFEKGMVSPLVLH